MNLKPATIMTTILLSLAACLLLPGCENPVFTDGTAVVQLDPLVPENVGGNGPNEGVVNSSGFMCKDWYTGNGTYKYTPGSAGNFSVDFTYGGSNKFNVLCGKGWKAGTANRVVSYKGDFLPAVQKYSDGNQDFQNAMLTFYGWARNPSLTEYYVLESYGEYDPSQGTGNDKYNFQGTFKSAGNGATYHVYEMNRTGDNINGNGPFHQIYSIRMKADSDPTDSEKWSAKHREINPGTGLKGVIYLKDHMDKWSEKGWTLSNFDHQAMIIEAYNSSGKGTIEVIEGDVTPVINVPGPRPGTTPSGYPERLVALKAKYDSQYFTVNSSNWLVTTSGLYNTDSNYSRFWMVCMGGGKVAFRNVGNGYYLCAEGEGSQQAVANRTKIDLWETFDVELFPGYTDVYTFKNNCNGKYGITTRMGWYLRFDGWMQENIGRGAQFYITYLN